MKLKDGWYAKDENGEIYWYDEMPEKGQYEWNSEGEVNQVGVSIQIVDPWEDSLHKVEDGVITKVQTFEKDQKVLASYDRIAWYRRYYSHCKGGKHFVFANGKTSWSGEGISMFHFIKPAEEE